MVVANPKTTQTNKKEQRVGDRVVIPSVGKIDLRSLRPVLHGKDDPSKPSVLSLWFGLLSMVEESSGEMDLVQCVFLHEIYYNDEEEASFRVKEDTTANQ